MNAVYKQPPNRLSERSCIYHRNLGSMSAAPSDIPLIGLPSDTFVKDGLPHASAVTLYASAIAKFSGALPVMLPMLDDTGHVAATLERLDGVLITGAGSNVHPHFYGRPAHAQVQPFDKKRDNVSLAMIKHAVAGELPLLAICRGIQELNVALGGTLKNDIHNLPGHLFHRGRPGSTADQRFAPRQKINLVKDGRLAGLLGTDRLVVNSVHRQAIDRLADDLTVEARAEDGVIEAVSVKSHNGFAYGVQWHPEYGIADNPISQTLFRAFGEAAAKQLRS
jgi:putative glutamine amidotransferase